MLELLSKPAEGCQIFREELENLARIVGGLEENPSHQGWVLHGQSVDQELLFKGDTLECLT